jgi:ABC-type lipopolysaccharide export system ATPase subunit
MADSAPLLEVEDIQTCYGLSQVLFGMSLQVRAGEMVALMGRNGMGKTTTVDSFPRGARFFPTSPCAKISSQHRPIASALPIHGRWKTSINFFRGFPSAAATWEVICRAASSRCWRSAAR